MKSQRLLFTRQLCLLALLVVVVDISASMRPYEAGQFVGRIAWSADGNHNDPDDWVASPVALAIFAEAGLKDRLVHFDYNCILPLTNPEWEKTHAESVLGAARRYGYDAARIFDCRQNLEAAIESIVRAINSSTAADPLFFIIAGPMEVPFRAIEKSDPAKRPFVYCLSHSRWNDGYASDYKFTFNKRSVIELGVHWTQIRDQNERLSFGRYGQPARLEEFAPYFWMRDAREEKVRFLWERMLVSTRPDPSDAGMAWFLATGDEACDPAKLQRLLDGHQMPAIATARSQVRLEAENFRHVEGCEVDPRKDRRASHQLSVRVSGGTNAARLRTSFDEPFTSASGHYDVDVRYLNETNSRSRFALFLNGRLQGTPWESTGKGGWTTQRISTVAINSGDEIGLELQGAGARLDFVQLNGTKTELPPTAGPPTMDHPLTPRLVGDGWTIAGDPDLGPLTDPKQQPVDFGIWQAADGSWQVWSCIRGTKEPGKTRLFHRWEGAKLTDSNWTPRGIALQADPALGETQGGLQAPYVFHHESKFWMVYGDWVNICLATSVDGKNFTRHRNADGKPQLNFPGPVDRLRNSRDPMVLRFGSKWHCYYTAHPGNKGSDYVRMSDDLLNWGEEHVVAARGRSGDGPYSAECPFVVEPAPGHFYLFRTQRYGRDAQTMVYHSRDPLDFGVDNDAAHYVTTLAVAAPEVLRHEGRWYLAALLPTLKGIQITRLEWAPAR